MKNVHIGDRRLFLIIDEVWCERKWRKTYWYSFNGQTPPYLMGKYKMYCVYIWRGARSLVQIQGVYIYLSILKFLPLHTVYTFNRGPPRVTKVRNIPEVYRIQDSQAFLSGGWINRSGIEEWSAEERES